MNRYITLDDNNKVIGVRWGATILEGELEIEGGALGQIMQPDGTFVNDPAPQPEPLPTLQEQIEGLKQDNIILMDAIATLFEEILMLGGTV